MKSILAALVLVPTALVAQPVAASPAAVTAPAPAPVHNLSITGPGVGTYPAFDASVERYGITSTEGSNGVVRVAATTSDRAGKVFIDGRLAPSGKRTIRGLKPNDEVSVIIKDTSGTAEHSAIYLPPGFPTLERTTPEGPALEPGLVLLTLSTFANKGAAPFYETAVDRNGVPVWARRTSESSIDFKKQPNGKFSASRNEAAQNPADGAPVVELDSTLEPTGRTFKTVDGLVNTDNHDSIVYPDGRAILLGYEPNQDTGLTDAVVQEINPDGTEAFRWDSSDFADESVAPPGNPDYAHVNSVVVMADGDLLVSFRHLSSVYKIARTAHDGFKEGEVIWKLGGRDSDFTFVEDESGGPCAQHTASETPAGNILIFSNGAGGVGPNFCVDQDDPNGPTHSRTKTFITEYDITSVEGEAKAVRNYSENTFALFAGGTEMLPGGNLLIGWAAARESVATELSPTNDVLWSLRDAAPEDRKFTYRAHIATVPDVIDPKVTLPVKNGATYEFGQVVRPAYSCTDRGGSSLKECKTTGILGNRLNTSKSGRRTVSVTAEDGHGNTTTESRSYTVGPAHRPDAMIRRGNAQRYAGVNVYGPPTRQRVNHAIWNARRSKTAIIRIRNRGEVAERFRIRGLRGGPRFRVAYFHGAKNLTRPVLRGKMRTPRLKPGRNWYLRIKVTRTFRARRGNSTVFNVRTTSVGNRAWDTVALKVRAR
ncbi:MAG: aryl-sulfate sulfotransferase [Nocardioides sp.]|nr:aryl-sulfate sulfotransferase [Nocardioides sp.]